MRSPSEVILLLKVKAALELQYTHKEPWGEEVKHNPYPIVLDTDNHQWLSDTGPQIKDHDNGWGANDALGYIFWEEGPTGWTRTFPYGDGDSNHKGAIRDVSDLIPEGMFVETVCEWGLVAIYKDVKA